MNLIFYPPNDPDWVISNIRIIMFYDKILMFGVVSLYKHIKSDGVPTWSSPVANTDEPHFYPAGNVPRYYVIL